MGTGNSLPIITWSPGPRWQPHHAGGGMETCRHQGRERMEAPDLVSCSSLQCSDSQGFVNPANLNTG